MFKELIESNITKFQSPENKNNRFKGIYSPDDSKSSDSESEDSQKQFGEKKLSSTKKNKIIEFLFVEINISR